MVRRVLVLDNDSVIADVLGLLLERWGYEVRVAYDGPTARAIAREFRPDVALLDLDLSEDQTGYDVARWFRSQPGLERTALVAVTGLEADHPIHRRGVQLDHHFLKPVDPEALREVLRQIPGP